MPIVKCAASKATPSKGINYIMDPDKVIAKGCQNFVTRDPKKMAHQIMQTMHFFGKGYDPDERKYYHAKVSFNPMDRQENGGTLDATKANQYAYEYAKQVWPDREAVWAVQDHGTSIHIHFILAACDMLTGKKLDVRDAEYRAWKDQAQDLAKKYGLSTLDWRKATKEKRDREIQSDLPIDESFAEQGMKARGKATWKDELREKIDAAVKSSNSMEDFKAALQAAGVELTRCTEQTISYKLGEHKACRGDTLGGDYTADAIRSALTHNKTVKIERGEVLDDMILKANKRAEGIDVGLDRRSQLREYGRLAGFSRAEIDAMTDDASTATWEEKMKMWERYKADREAFWKAYQEQQEAIQAEIDAAYRRRKRIQQAEWMLDPRNRRKTMAGVLIAGIYLCRQDSKFIQDIKLGQLKREQQKLREDAAAFKSSSCKARETLREKGLALDAYAASLHEMDALADRMYAKATGEARDIGTKQPSR